MEDIFYFFTHELTGIFMLILFFFAVFAAGFINVYALISFAPLKINLNNRTGIAGVIAVTGCVCLPYIIVGYPDFFVNDFHLLIGGITGSSWAALKLRRSVNLPQIAGTNQASGYYFPLKLLRLLGVILG